MAHRKSNPPTLDLVNALNTIDIVFEGNKKVLDLWHQYYDLLCQQPINGHLIEAKYLDLLSAIAASLGVSTLAQTDIARFYSPIAHATQAQLNYELQSELLRVLRGSNTVQFIPRNSSSSSEG